MTIWRSAIGKIDDLSIIDINNVLVPKAVSSIGIVIFVKIVDSWKLYHRWEDRHHEEFNCRDKHHLQREDAD